MTQDTALSRALLRRNELRRELARVEAFLQEYAVWAEKPVISPETPEVRRPIVWSGTGKEQVAEIAVRLLREAGRPLRRGVLFDKIIASGVSISGKDPHKTMSTMLYRMRHRVALYPDGYWPEGDPYPHIGLPTK